MSLSRAKDIFAPANINTIIIRIMIDAFYTFKLGFNEFLIPNYVMRLDSKQTDKNSKSLLESWARCVGDQTESKEPKRSKIKSSGLVANTVKEQVTKL